MANYCISDISSDLISSGARHELVTHSLCTQSRILIRWRTRRLFSIASISQEVLPKCTSRNKYKWKTNKKQGTWRYLRLFGLSLGTAAREIRNKSWRPIVLELCVIFYFHRCFQMCKKKKRLPSSWKGDHWQLQGSFENRPHGYVMVTSSFHLYCGSSHQFILYQNCYFCCCCRLYLRLWLPLPKKRCRIQILAKYSINY